MCSDCVVFANVYTTLTQQQKDTQRVFPDHDHDHDCACGRVRAADDETDDARLSRVKGTTTYRARVYFISSAVSRRARRGRGEPARTSWSRRPAPYCVLAAARRPRQPPDPCSPGPSLDRPVAVDVRFVFKLCLRQSLLSARTVDATQQHSTLLRDCGRPSTCSALHLSHK